MRIVRRPATKHVSPAIARPKVVRQVLGSQANGVDVIEFVAMFVAVLQHAGTPKVGAAGLGQKDVGIKLSRHQYEITVKAVEDSNLLHPG